MSIKTNLFSCTCKDCGYGFYTSCDEHTSCPSCGKESISYSDAFEAVIFDKKEEKEMTIKETVINFFKERNLKLPDRVELDMEWQHDDEPWQYLGKVVIKNSNNYINVSNLEDELEELINDNFTINDMNEYKYMDFES